jgi:hypothetical protein
VPPWGSAFFGLGPGDKELLIWEPAFLLTYYGGLTASEAYDLPVPIKRWWVDRIVKELNKQSANPGDGESSASRALHANSPEVRQLQGRTRPSAPSRLRRFT